MTVKDKGKEKKEEEKQHLSKEIGNYQLTTMAIDVFGKEVEPICDYLRCHHKLSVHGLSASKCRCKHPQNDVIGA
jgi:purine nucleoside permease